MPRKSYIDIAKGVAMLLVIMQHTGGGEVAITTLCKVDVPLFFLCSGLLAYKSEIAYFDKLKKITQRILLPFFSACLFASFFYDESPICIFTSVGKRGYWFLEALFIIFLIFYCQHKFFKKSLYLLIGSTVIIEVIFLLQSKFGPEGVNNILVIPYLARYYPCFIAGCLLTRNNITETKRITSSALLLIALTAFLLPSSGNVNFVSNIIGYLASSIYVYFLIKDIHIQIPAPISKSLVKIGQYSLDIYIIHFFVVKYYPHISDNPLLTFVASLSMALLISGFCILVSKLISRTTIFGFALNR